MCVYDVCTLLCHFVYFERFSIKQVKRTHTHEVVVFLNKDFSEFTHILVHAASDIQLPCHGNLLYTELPMNPVFLHFNWIE